MTDKNSFIFYESFLEAMEEMDSDTVKETLFAIARYALSGEEPADLHGWARSVFVMAKPQIDANNDRYEKSLGGGRPQSKLPSQEELEAMRQELGSWDAVADRLGVNKATLFRRRQTAKSQNESQNESQKSQNESQIAKPNVHENVNVHENENENGEREGARSAPDARQAAHAPPQSSSATSVVFPAERARRTPPPTREEVHALCKEAGYCFDPDTFFAYYAATGWRRKGGAKVEDWVLEAELWEKRERREIEQARARASPAPEYRTWRAEDAPKVSEEERAAVAAGLKEIFGNLRKKIAAGGGA